MNNYEDKTDDRKEAGGPAFPNKSVYGRCEACGWDENSSVPGMTLRDYFAAKAMQGMSANPEVGFIDISAAANEAYKMADAMLKERNKEE